MGGWACGGVREAAKWASGGWAHDVVCCDVMEVNKL